MDSTLSVCTKRLEKKDAARQAIELFLEKCSNTVKEGPVRGTPKLLFCAATGPIAHNLLIPGDPTTNEEVELYAVCAVGTRNLFTIDAIDVKIYEWTLSQRSMPPIRIDEVAKFGTLLLQANVFAIESLYVQKMCYESEEWKELKQSYRDLLITDNVIKKFTGPAQNYLWAKEKKQKLRIKQQRKREEQARRQSNKPKKEHPPEKAKALSEIEQKMKKKQELRNQLAEQRRERQNLKQQQEEGGGGGGSQSKGDELYNYVRLLFQAKRLLASEDLIISYDEQNSEERELLLSIRRGEIAEEEVSKRMEELIQEIEETKHREEKNALWKGQPRQHSMDPTLLDEWIVALRRKETYMGSLE